MCGGEFGVGEVDILSVEVVIFAIEIDIFSAHVDNLSVDGRYSFG